MARRWVLFGCPDQAAGKVKYAIEVPKLSRPDFLKHSLVRACRARYRYARKLAAGADHVPGRSGSMVVIGISEIRGLACSALWSALAAGNALTIRCCNLFALAMGPGGFFWPWLAGWITTETGGSRSRCTAVRTIEIRLRRSPPPRSPRH